jgi:hypothetical protein
MEHLSETPDQLARRVDRLYLTLASVYRRVGRALDLPPKRASRRRQEKDATPEKRLRRSTAQVAKKRAEVSP